MPVTSYKYILVQRSNLSNICVAYFTYLYFHNNTHYYESMRQQQIFLCVDLVENKWSESDDATGSFLLPGVM